MVNLTFKLFLLFVVGLAQGQLGADVEEVLLKDYSIPDRDAALRDMEFVLAPVLAALLVAIAAQTEIVAELVHCATTAFAAPAIIWVVHSGVAVLEDRHVAPMAVAALGINIASLVDVALEEKSAVAPADGAVRQDMRPAGQIITVAVEYFPLPNHISHVLTILHYLPATGYTCYRNSLNEPRCSSGGGGGGAVYTTSRTTSTYTYTNTYTTRYTSVSTSATSTRPSPTFDTDTPDLGDLFPTTTTQAPPTAANINGNRTSSSSTPAMTGANGPAGTGGLFNHAEGRSIPLAVSGLLYTLLPLLFL
ncbi:hypothetical protein EST38_g1504 [Candolleomyces aberdarensis]|uniref:Uncharacterized protein n=1 Tax=Candolleomyces aberdarensis TaxID=2316362 RepID=A0A4Q2DV87_9AGAR|nr:hypothetical protein EST38_g1504 [Candolleomyces aberdarensis]